MRTTIDLPDDLCRDARNVAHERNRILSQVVVEWIERGRRELPDVEPREDPLTGLTVMHFGGPPITHEDVRSLEDDE